MAFDWLGRPLDGHDAFGMRHDSNPKTDRRFSVRDVRCRRPLDGPRKEALLNWRLEFYLPKV